MVPKENRSDAESPDVSPPVSVLESLRVALSDANEPDRYRMLAGLFTEFARHSQAGADGREHGAVGQIEALNKRVRQLTEEKAAVLDQQATTRADLDHCTAQLAAEQTRAHELEPVIEEQRARLGAARKELKDLEARVTACEAELHKAHTENDQLSLKLQRAELTTGDRSGIERLEESKRGLTTELESVRKDMEQLHADKDAEIADLNGQLAAARSRETAAVAISFEALWERLAEERPPLVDGAVRPTQQSAERLVATLVELVRFVDDFDKLMRPFLSKYTKHHPPVKVPWDVYAKRDDARKTIEQVLAPVGGKPVGVVRNRLRGLYRWTNGAMIACDVSIESIASELHTFLMGPTGAGSDPNRTIKEFLRGDGHELFLQHIRELRGLKLADAFGRGG